MKLVQQRISLAELSEIAGQTFGTLVKAVVDTEKEIMVIDAVVR